MNIEINRIQWKCRRGMREIDLLLREFSNSKLQTLDKDNLDYDDQTLFDYIFKQESLNNKIHEDFINKYLKKFTKQGNF